MGVIYKSCDDVAELLVPFIQCRSETNSHEIERNYHSASLGHISSSEFWENVGLNIAVEDEYLSEHVLAPGLLEFLEIAREYVDSIWCLSNDVSEWSRKLRTRFDIERLFNGFAISGDIGIRKPDINIYTKFLGISGLDTTKTVFIDDRHKNLISAAMAGLSPVLFGTRHDDLPDGIGQAENFDDVLTILRS